MLKLFGTVIATSLVLCPIASAAGMGMEEIEVRIVYDGDLLETEEGMQMVMASIEGQAKEACTTTSSYNDLEYVDRSCVKDIAQKAISKIKTVEVANGRQMTAKFASLDPIAQSAEQR